MTELERYFLHGGDCTINQRNRIGEYTHEVNTKGNPIGIYSVVSKRQFEKEREDQGIHIYTK